ncbi:MAG: hypothetical protein K2O01_08740 [Bacteroidales bacterium]|nr:hypothetical protein [Bacteroidales bacterium]
MKKPHIVEHLIFQAAIRWEKMPFWSLKFWGAFFDLSRMARLSADEAEARHLPARVGLRRIKGNDWNPADGTYRFGTLPLTVGQRFSALQAIQGGDYIFEPLKIYFHLRRFEVLCTRLGKIAVLLNHIQSDLKKRNERDQRTIVPLTDLQRQVGIGNMNHGLFGIIDFIACRNHLTYKQVYELSDIQLYGILQIEHDRTLAARQYDQALKQKHERQLASQRTHLGSRR